jgi:hypothetical protein
VVGEINYTFSMVVSQTIAVNLGEKARIARHCEANDFSIKQKQEFSNTFSKRNAEAIPLLLGENSRLTTNCFGITP